jgi:hypothetical protein
MWWVNLVSGLHLCNEGRRQPRCAKPSDSKSASEIFAGWTFVNEKRRGAGEPAGTQFSLLSQRDDRIDARRPPRRKVTGQ